MQVRLDLGEGKHPRVCGEDTIVELPEQRLQETPPRMRGRHKYLYKSVVILGNTPAYAGKTRQNQPRICRRQKHPRVCGEDLPAREGAPADSETPPRMRGRPADAMVKSLLSRNTPAYAGKTIPRQSRKRCPGKHPRVCGEDHTCAFSFLTLRETPPRMRGRRNGKTLETEDTGNTPAYAGKTLLHPSRHTEKGKHPRVCGEDFFAPSVRRPALETPPRMRGRQGAREVAVRLVGNTPAYAGKTRRQPLVVNFAQKHPRVCGEDTNNPSGPRPAGETPPRMRGRPCLTPT